MELLSIKDLNIYQFLKDICKFINDIGVWVYDNIYLSLAVALAVILAFLLVKILT